MERVESPNSWAGDKVASIVLRAAYAIGVLIYVAFFTDGFTFFQKVVVVLVAIIIYGAAESILRVRRGGLGRWR